MDKFISSFETNQIMSNVKFPNGNSELPKALFIHHADNFLEFSLRVFKIIDLSKFRACNIQSSPPFFPDYTG